MVPFRHSSVLTSLILLGLLCVPACRERGDGHRGRFAEEHVSWIPAWNLTPAQRDRFLFPRITEPLSTNADGRCLTPQGEAAAPVWLVEAVSAAHCTQSLRKLVDAQKTAPVGADPQALLTVAALCGRVEVVESLLAAAVLPNRHDACGWTALVAAASSGKSAVARMLLKAGADPSLAARQGSWSRTPLLAAVIRGDEQLVAVLLQAGADANATTPQGRTPLMFAATFGRADLVRSLIRGGASACRRDASGLTAKSVANAHSIHEVDALMQMATLRECGETVP